MAKTTSAAALQVRLALSSPVAAAALPSPDLADPAIHETLRDVSASRLRQADFMSTGMSDEHALSSLRYRETFILAESGVTAARHL